MSKFKSFQELIVPVSISSYELLKGQIDYLSNRSNQFQAVINDIIDEESNTTGFFQSDLGFFKIQDLRAALASDADSIDMPVEIYDAAGVIKEVVDADELMSSLTGTIQNSAMYISALESIQDVASDDVSQALQRFQARTAGYVSSGYSNVASSYAYICSVLSNSFTTAESMVKSLMGAALLDDSGNPSWMESKATLYSGVSLGTVLSNQIAPAVSQVAGAITSAIGIAVGGVWGIVTAGIGAFISAIGYLANPESFTDYPIVAKIKGQVPSTYISGRDIFQLSYSELAGNSLQTVFYNIVDSIHSSSSFAIGVWHTIPIGATRLSISIIQYSSPYSWTINCRLQLHVCGYDLPNSYDSSSQLWNTDYTILKQYINDGQWFWNNNPEGTENYVSDDSSYPSIYTMNNLIEARKFSAWVACRYHMLFSAGNSAEVPSYGYGDWNDHIGVTSFDRDSSKDCFCFKSSVGFTPHGSYFYKMSNLALFNQFSGEVIKELIINDDSSASGYGYLYLMLYGARYYLYMASSGADWFKDADAPRWWQSLPFTPSFAVRTDAELKAQYAVQASAMITLITATVITITSAIVSTALKKKAFKARRKADNIAFDENASDKEAYRANKKACLIEGLYNASTKVLNFGASSLRSIAGYTAGVISSTASNIAESVVSINQKTAQLTDNLSTSGQSDNIEQAIGNLSKLIK